MMDVRGSDIGMFDEMGSVYAWNIKFVEVDGEWKEVELTEKQMTDQKRVSIW